MDGTAAVRVLDDGSLLLCERTTGPFSSEAELTPIQQMIGMALTIDLTAPPQGLCVPNSPGILYFLGGPDLPAPPWGCVVD